jgi:DNA primase small subunit
MLNVKDLKDSYKNFLMLDQKEWFKKYYSNAKIFVKNIEKREFGVSFDKDKKIEQRHISFKNDRELMDYLSQNVPFYISYSAAYYNYPSMPMEKKEWLGAELVFDLDANDLNLECKKVHGSENICSNCFEAIKEEALKLIDFLIYDFGFKKEEINVNFSGNRGFHFHVENEEILKLSSYARREICDYLSANGLEFENFFYEVPSPANPRQKILHGPKPSDYGWYGKLANLLLNSLDSLDKLIEIGIPKKEAKKLFEKKDIIKLGIMQGNWDMVYIKNKKKFWKDFIEKQKIKLKEVVDTNVTIDTSRLIRLPDSIHGGSSLIAKKIDLNEIQQFSLNEAVIPSKEKVKVKINIPYDFDLFGYKLKKGSEELEVPIGEALYFYSKGWLIE